MFPYQSMKNATATCCRVYKVLDMKIERCLQWRSEQPAITSGEDDMASIHFLKRLLSHISLNVVTKVAQLREKLVSKGQGNFSQLERLGVLQLKFEKKLNKVEMENGLFHIPAQSSRKRSVAATSTTELSSGSDEYSVTSDLESQEPESVALSGDSDSDSMRADDDSASFGADGWGDSSDDDGRLRLGGGMIASV